jgi:5-methylcytosine-specific restriction protein B
MLMTEKEAAALLKALYHDPSFGKVVGIHLFGIRHAAELRGLDLREVTALASLPESYGTEIRKGMALAPFVRER